MKKMRGRWAFWTTVSVGPTSSLGDEAFMLVPSACCLARMWFSTSAPSSSVLTSLMRALRFDFTP
jgi:hypothetical protein